MPYTVALDALITDKSVVEELRRIQAAFAGLSTLPTRADAEAGLDTGAQVNTLPIDDAGRTDAAVRWLKGPWLLNADGDAPGIAVIRPPTIAADQNNYAPLGIDTAIGMELMSSAAVTLTGIRSAKLQRRLLFIENRGQFTISIAQNSANSLDANRFGFGDPGELLAIPSRRVVWFYYDTFDERWRLFALPAIDPNNLPASLKAALTFPPEYEWFGSRFNGNSATLAGIGEADIITVGGTLRKETKGIGRDFSTAAAPGAGNGINSGGSAQVCPQNDPTWTVLIRTGASIADIRIWVILTNTVSTDADNLGGGSAYIGFRYSTVASDPGWVGVMRDGGTQSVTGIVAAIATDTMYKLKVRKSGGTVYFSVNGGAEVSSSANVPAAATELAWDIRWFAQAAAAKTVTIFQHMVKFGISF